MQADSSYLNSAASGEAYVYLGTGHTSVTDPVILIEGFDIYDSYNWPELYDLMNQENMIEDMAAMGFDAVVLNFDDPVTYIQENGLLAMKLIQMVNDSISYQRQPVIIGASMGGLVSRYALLYMELNGFDHNIRTFISYDSPQHGANMPLGIQFWINFFASQSADAAYLDGRLLSPAAKQILMYHYTQSGNLAAGSDPLLPQLQLELAGMGDYPQLVRKVSIVNGSGTSTNQGFQPAAQIVEYEYSSWVIGIKGNCWAVPTLSQSQVFEGLIDYPWPLSDDQMDVYLNPGLPLDNCPGGFRTTMLDLQNQTAPYGSIVALYPNHAFIPTVSALAIDTSNFFYNAQTDANILDRTPFDQVYFPSLNEEHIFISPESKNWFMKEVMHTVTATNEPNEKENLTIFPNPSTGAIWIEPHRTEVYNIEILTIDGILVKTTNKHSTTLLTQKHKIALRDPGLYIINIETNKGVYSKRIIILQE